MYNTKKFYDAKKLKDIKLKFVVTEKGTLKPVVKNNGEYFVASDYHIEELKKKEDEIDNYKNLVGYYKHELKEVEKENIELKEKLKHFLERLGRI